MISLNQYAARGGTRFGPAIGRQYIPTMRVHNLGVYDPRTGTDPDTQISPMEIGAGAVGTGLLVGGLVLGKAPGIVMSIFGGLALLGTAVSVLPKAVGAVQRAVVTPPPPPPLPPPPPSAPTATRAQKVASYASIAMPFVEGLLKIF